MAPQEAKDWFAFNDVDRDGKVSPQLLISENLFVGHSRRVSQATLRYTTKLPLSTRAGKGLQACECSGRGLAMRKAAMRM